MMNRIRIKFARRILLCLLCGIFGLQGNVSVAAHTLLGMFARGDDVVVPIVHVKKSEQTITETSLLNRFVEHVSYFDKSERILCIFQDLDGDGRDEALLTFSIAGTINFPVWDFCLAKQDESGVWTFPFEDSCQTPYARLGLDLRNPVIFLTTKKYPHGGFLSWEGVDDMSPRPIPRCLYVLASDGFPPVENASNGSELTPEDLGEEPTFFENLFNNLSEGVTVFAYEIPEGIKPRSEMAPPWIKRVLEKEEDQ
ncbi:MAG: hypothetical protein K6B46_03310 [Opitutales bacterium]|nr:hypothetical protein [Opitutales bacterium]